jgi:hypothetical protein
VVVRDLDICCSCHRPPEADAELIVHPDAVLPSAIPPQCLKSVAWWDAQVVESAGDLQLPQLATRRPFDSRESPDAPAFR